MNSSFSISEAFSYGWETFKKHWKFLVPYFIIIIAIQFVFSYFGGEKSPLGSASIFVNIIGIIVSIFISASLVKTMLMIYSSKEVSLSRNIFISIWKEVLKYIRVSLAMMIYLFPIWIPLVVMSLSLVFSTPAESLITFTVIVFSGMVIILLFPITLVILSGILFSQYISFDYNFGIFESVKYSQKITKGYRSKIFLFLLISGLIIILGIVCVLIGLIVVIPVVSLAQVYVYKKLDAQYQAKNGEVPTNVPQPEAIVNIQEETIIDIETRPEEIIAPKPETIQE